jgi:hypothetical protein
LLVRPEREVVGRDRLFEQRPDLRLAAPVDAVNRARAVADVHAPRAVEREPRRDAEVAREGHDLVEGRDAVDRPVHPRGDVHLPEAVEGDAGRVRDLARHARHLARRVYAEERDGHALPARARARDVDRAVVRVNGRVRDEVQVVGELAADDVTLAELLRCRRGSRGRLPTSPPSSSVSGTMASTRQGAAPTMRPSAPSNVARHSRRLLVSYPAHSTDTSPPGIAAAGSTLTICPLDIETPRARRGRLKQNENEIKVDLIIRRPQGKAKGKKNREQ